MSTESPPSSTVNRRLPSWMWVISASAIASSLALACGPASDGATANPGIIESTSLQPPASVGRSLSESVAPATEAGTSTGNGTEAGTSTGNGTEAGASTGNGTEGGTGNTGSGADGGKVADSGHGTEGGVATEGGAGTTDAGGAPDSGTSTSDAATGGPVVTHAAAMPMISQGLPAYSNYAASPAASAVDADYSTAWRTGHNPSQADSSWLAIDVSSVPVSMRTTVYSVWFNEYGYNYDTSDGSSYTLPGDFAIQASAAPGGGQPPASGWTTLTSKTGNTLSSGANLLDLTGYNWVRFDCTASAPNVAAQNTDTSLQWNLYDAHAGNDGWKFGGDSITANSMGHKATNDSFDQLVHAKVANDPAFEMAGHGGWSTATMLASIDGFLADFPGLYFGLSLGTNDAPGNDAPSYRVNMGQLVDKVLAAGKIPVVPDDPLYGRADARPDPGLQRADPGALRDLRLQARPRPGPLHRHLRRPGDHVRQSHRSAPQRGRQRRHPASLGRRDPRERLLSKRRSTEPHPDFVATSCARLEDDSIRSHRRAVESDLGDTGAHRVGILDHHVDLPRAVTNPGFESLPGRRNAGLDAKLTVLPAQTEDGLDAEPVGPGGGAGVPGPSPPADPGRTAIDVAGENVRLDQVVTRSVGRRVNAGPD